MTPTTAYRAGLGLAIGAALFLIQLGLGVGRIGADGDPLNLVYPGVLAVGLIGALSVRFRAAGMARVLAGVAVAIVATGLVAVAAKWGQPFSMPAEVLGLTAGFATLFAGSARLVRRAAAGQAAPAS